MIKFLKFVVFIAILLFLSVVGLFWYVNSDSFAHLVEDKISKELGNNVSFSDLRIHSDGRVTIKGLKVLDLDDQPLLTAAKVKVNVEYGDLLDKDYLPQKVELYNVDLDFRVKEGCWPLALLNREKKLPPSPNFYAVVKSINLQLTKRNAELKEYAIEADLSSAEVENVPVISSLIAKGVVSERALKFDSINFGLFSGVVKSVVTVLLDQNQGVEKVHADVNLSEIDLSEVSEFAKLAPMQILGILKGQAQVGLVDKKMTLDADLSTGALSMTGPGVKRVLTLLKHGEKTLGFNSAHIKINGTEEFVRFSTLEFLNRSFISLYAPETKISFDDQFQPKHIKLPLRLSAPYDVIKWRDFLSEKDPSYIEIPVDLDCEVGDVKAELTNALIYTIQKHSLKKTVKQLEDKMGFKIDDQVIDVNKVLDHENYKEIKQKVKKEVDRIDREQVDEIIDAFEKDDKKKEKLKKNIDLFMQFLQ